MAFKIGTKEYFCDYATAHTLAYIHGIDPDSIQETGTPEPQDAFTGLCGPNLRVEQEIAMHDLLRAHGISGVVYRRAMEIIKAVHE